MTAVAMPETVIAVEIRMHKGHLYTASVIDERTGTTLIEPFVIEKLTVIDERGLDPLWPNASEFDFKPPVTF